MGLRIRIRAHLSRKVKRRALKLMDIQTEVQQNGDNLLSIKASADAELMDRASFAMNQKLVRFTFSQQFVCDIVEGIHSENRSHSRFNLTFSDKFIRFERNLAHDVTRLLIRYTGNFHLRNPHRLGIDIHRLAMTQFGSERPDEILYTVQQRQLFQCRLPASVNDDVNAFGIEAHHVVLFQIRLDGHVRNTDIVLISSPSEHVNALGDDVSQIVEPAVVAETGREVHADDDVGTHFFRQVRRIVVPHATVHQHHTVHLDRSEYARNGHRGAQCRVQLAFIPYFRFSRHHLRRHAHERYREVHEIHVVLIADSQ